MKSPAHPTPRGDSPLLRVLPVVLAALVLSLLSPRSVASAPAPSPLAFLTTTHAWYRSGTQVRRVLK